MEVPRLQPVGPHAQPQGPAVPHTLPPPQPEEVEEEIPPQVKSARVSHSGGKL